MVFLAGAGEFGEQDGPDRAAGATIAFFFLWCSIVGAVWAVRKLDAYAKSTKQVAAPATPPVAESVPPSTDIAELQAQHRRLLAEARQRPVEQQGKAVAVTLQQALRDRRTTPKIPSGKRPRTGPKLERSVNIATRDHASGWAGFITYEDAKGDITERRIVVKRIDGYGRAEAISAWCCERNAPRRFAVSGILELACVETGEILDPQRHFDRLAQEGAIGSTDKSLADLVTIMVFLARCDGDFHPMEMECIDRALEEHMMLFGGEPKAIRATAKKARQLAPDGEDFLAALDRIERHPRRPQLAGLVLDAAEDVIQADGEVLAAEEDWYDDVLSKLEDMAMRQVA